MSRHHVVITKPDRSLIEDQVDSSDLATYLARHNGPGVSIFVDRICITPARTGGVDLVQDLSQILIERERQLSKLHVERERQLADAWDQQRETQARALEDLSHIGRCATGTRIRDEFRRAGATRAHGAEGHLSWQVFLQGMARVFRKVMPPESE